MIPPYRFIRMQAPALACLLALAACADADPEPLTDNSWTVDSQDTDFAFVTVKAGSVVEAHSFNAVSGSVAPDGGAELAIDLSSLETGVDVRDERMRAILFDVANYPKAQVTAQLDPAAFGDLAVGDSMTMPVHAALSLHGVEQEVDADLRVLRAGPDKVVVETVKPIIVDGDSFGLGEGLAKLQELAKLPAITPSVPVSFSITFTRVPQG
ncbi:conserved hypothetical protein [Altererythrobacter sp. B11]|uniref:YceI family protein n=1 Tax=Altererythrobacter sp. B11 TaxID=2060312 RepID=UPI000DC6D66F|nr:YceI family protein [Altererythrobacter sp. B11]BBC71073.1 conserved hypothetical protein [Altererythrobacter sp. B11]